MGNTDTINWFYNDFDKKTAEAVCKTIDERKISMGPLTQKLEESFGQYVGTKYCSSRHKWHHSFMGFNEGVDHRGR